MVCLKSVEATWSNNIKEKNLTSDFTHLVLCYMSLLSIIYVSHYSRTALNSGRGLRTLTGNQRTKACLFSGLQNVEIPSETDQSFSQTPPNTHTHICGGGQENSSQFIYKSKPIEKEKWGGTRNTERNKQSYRTKGDHDPSMVRS